MTLPRPCLDCGTPTDATRCPDCAPPPRDRRSDPGATQRGYDARWERLSKRARRMQPWCSRCGSTEELTGDHLRWPARSLEDVDVLCQSCNSRKGAIRTNVTQSDQPRGTTPTNNGLDGGSKASGPLHTTESGR